MAQKGEAKTTEKWEWDKTQLVIHELYCVDSIEQRKQQRQSDTRGSFHPDVVAILPVKVRMRWLSVGKQGQ